MNQDPTTCEFNGSQSSYNCARYEQCDDCFMIDHQKECSWCEHYDHDERKLPVSHGTETHYDVVWKDGKPMTKIDEHIWLK